MSGERRCGEDAAFEEGSPRRHCTIECILQSPASKPNPLMPQTTPEAQVRDTKREKLVAVVSVSRKLHQLCSRAESFPISDDCSGAGPVEGAGSHFYPGIVLCTCRFGAECGLSSGLGRGRLHRPSLGQTNEMPGFVIISSTRTEYHVSVSSPADCLAPVYLGQHSHSPPVRPLQRCGSGRAYAPTKETIQTTACVSLSMGFSDDPSLSVGLGRIAAVSAVGRNGGDVAECRILPVPAFGAPRANLGEGRISGRLSRHMASKLREELQMYKCYQKVPKRLGQSGITLNNPLDWASSRCC